MKKYLALVLVMAVMGAAFAGNKPRKSSRQEMGINGNALYVIEYTYNLHGGQNGGRQLSCIDSITFGTRTISTCTATPSAGTNTTVRRN